MSNEIETALTGIGVTYTDAEADMIHTLHHKLFKNSLDVVGIRIAVPDNTSHPFHLFVPPKNLCIQRILNASYDRIYNEDVTFVSTNSYTSITPDSTDSYVVYKHGDGILFRTEDAAYNADLECMVTPKTNLTLDDELRLVLLYGYYYLYTENKDGAYNYIRRISNIKKNTVAQFTHKLPVRQMTWGDIVPFQM